MTTLSYAMRDSTTMLRRNLRHMQRYPSLTIMLLGQPILLLLLFVYVFGGTLGDGLGPGGVGPGGVGGRAEYVGYVTPAILLITITSAILGTSISVATDMTEGIINRFRTMAISRSSVLTGHVIGTVLQTVFALAVVLGVALLIGFSPTAGPGEWLALIGVLLLVTVALTWFAVALGMKAKSVETASNTPMLFTLLPFLGSGFVPADSMPAWLGWFAEYQPFTPIIETMRGLLLGTGIGNGWLFAVGWCVLITAVGYVWSKSLFAKERD
ncbi:MAG: ABC transporter permease [Actinophytocola sp.]|uniref:ABC transporter permease n=1 Tax=Actinophytocola sp. TaxID=1872138 RepID=UPI00132A1D13|nr:ABC transporter permease [Actinophytocola sp.]MPZ86418.1 ABC transporter permease [Actinophytocola sp.]